MILNFILAVYILTLVSTWYFIYHTKFGTWKPMLQSVKGSPLTNEEKNSFLKYNYPLLYKQFMKMAFNYVIICLIFYITLLYNFAFFLAFTVIVILSRYIFMENGIVSKITFVASNFMFFLWGVYLLAQLGYDTLWNFIIDFFKNIF